MTHRPARHRRANNASIAVASRGGFTLIELLVVIGLVAGATAFLIGGLRDHPGASLRSAQATLANVLTAARTRAMASGCRVRVLIHADTSRPERFRRAIAVQQESTYDSDDWAETVAFVTLPEGVVVLPHASHVPVGLFADQAEWTKTDGSGALLSTSLGQQTTAAVQSAEAELWDVVQFTPANTMSTVNGNLILATCRTRPPGTFGPGESPVEAESPDRVRGIVVSRYGVLALVAGRDGF